MQRIRKGFFLGMLTLCLLLGGCARNVTQQTDRVQTVAAVTGSVHQTAAFVGNVTSGQSVTLSWNTSGVIDSVFFELGDTVAEGQTMAALGSDFLAADVLKAEIPYISALEDLDEVMNSETPKAQVFFDLKNAEANLISSERYQESLKYPHAVSSDIAYWAGQVDIYREAYDEAQTSLNDAASWRNSPYESERNLYDARRITMLNALNRYAEVYNTYLYYSSKPSDNDFAQAAANIGTAQADYDKALVLFQTYSRYPRDKDVAAAQLKVSNAQDIYNRRNVIASINGVVTGISAREGDYVTAGAAAFRLDNLDHLYIPLEISEIDILNFQEGMEALVVLDADPEKTYSGVVVSVSQSGSTADSRVTFETLIEILEPDQNVKIGMTAEVRLVLAERENVLIVPLNAVFTDEGNSYVSVFNGNTTYDVPVTTGISSDTIIEITGGYLRSGDLVCVPSLDSNILRDMGLSGSADPEMEKED